MRPDREGARAQAHVPLLKELLQDSAMGRAEWRDEFGFGFPMIGKLGEPGYFPSSFQTSDILILRNQSYFVVRF